MRRTIVVLLFAIMGAVLGMAGVAGAQGAPVCESIASPPCPAAIDPAADPAATGGVAGTSAVAGTRSLPYTGSSDTGTLVLVGFGLVLVGGAVVVFSYRRRAASLNT